MTGRLTGADGAAPVAGEPVVLRYRRVGATAWSTAGTAVSGADGVPRRAVTIGWSAQFQWVHAATAVAGAATSPVVVTTVVPTLTASAPTSVKLGATVTVSGTVKPTVAGRTVSLQRYVSGAWKTVASGKVGSTGKVAIKVKPARTGSYVYRLYLPKATDLAEAKSATRTVKVVRP